MRLRSAEFLTSAADARGFPRADAPEVAFLGRSNVGKSSLLNRLVGRKRLAHTSTTPGKTRLVNFYAVERTADALRLVDLPGYGFARVSQAERRRWRKLVEGYLEGRDCLRLAVLLQDVRRDLTEDETALLAWLAVRRIPALLAITKVDKLGRGARAERLRALAAQLPVPAPAWIATSAQTGAGVRELWQAIDAATAIRRADPPAAAPR